MSSLAFLPLILLALVACLFGATFLLLVLTERRRLRQRTATRRRAAFRPVVIAGGRAPADAAPNPAAPHRARLTLVRSV